MRGLTCYLAGGISGLSYDESTTWRHQATQMLSDAGITAYSPMRMKGMLNDGQTITAARSMDGSHPLRTSKGIMCRDYNDCSRADALLVNFAGNYAPSIGTAMELMLAYHLHIPVVCIGEPDNPNIKHPMSHEAIDFRVDTLAEGVALIKTILLPGGGA